MGPNSIDALKLQLESVMISLLPAFFSLISNVFLFSSLMISLDFYFPSYWGGIDSLKHFEIEWKLFHCNGQQLSQKVGDCQGH